jgi:hypothetical protein
MNSITDATVNIQTSSESVPATPPWLGAVALLVYHLGKQGVLDAIRKPGALCPPPLRAL